MLEALPYRYLITVTSHVGGLASILSPAVLRGAIFFSVILFGGS
jgi:hypothetical protein